MRAQKTKSFIITCPYCGNQYGNRGTHRCEVMDLPAHAAQVRGALEFAMHNCKSMDYIYNFQPAIDSFKTILGRLK